MTLKRHGSRHETFPFVFCIECKCLGRRGARVERSFCLFVLLLFSRDRQLEGSDLTLKRHGSRHETLPFVLCVGQYHDSAVVEPRELLLVQRNRSLERGRGSVSLVLRRCRLPQSSCKRSSFVRTCGCECGCLLLFRRYSSACECIRQSLSSARVRSGECRLVGSELFRVLFRVSFRCSCERSFHRLDLCFKTDRALRCHRRI